MIYTKAEKNFLKRREIKHNQNIVVEAGVVFFMIIFAVILFIIGLIGVYIWFKKHS